MQTRMPAPASPVIDNGGAGCASPDQRGEARPLGAACDIGAVEAVTLPLTCGVELEAIADTTVSSDSPDGQQGDWLTLRVANIGGVEARTLIAFDLAALRSGVPAGSHLSSAVLAVDRAPAFNRQDAAESTPVSDVLDVRALDQPWAESATWNTQPAPGASYARGGTLSAALLADRPEHAGHAMAERRGDGGQRRAAARRAGRRCDPGQPRKPAPGAADRAVRTRPRAGSRSIRKRTATGQSRPSPNCGRNPRSRSACSSPMARCSSRLST